MIRRVRLRSLAKINLDLRVLHKRPDNFHELRTVFQTISLADTLEIEYQPSARTRLALDDPFAIPDNLVLRAARAALDAIKTHAHIRFRLKKQIPMGGGLGGGSSNAAAVLMALPAFARRPIPPDRLLALAAEPMLLVASGIHVSTAAAYQALGRGLTSPDLSRKINGFQLFVRTLGDL